MDISKKLNANDLRAADGSQLKETEQELRKALAEKRMDVYTAAATNVGEIRSLKRSLARLKTVQNENARKAAKA